MDGVCQAVSLRIAPLRAMLITHTSIEEPDSSRWLLRHGSEEVDEGLLARGIWSGMASRQPRANLMSWTLRLTHPGQSLLEDLC